MLIKNLESLTTSPARRAALEVIEAGLQAIQPERVVEQVEIEGGILRVQENRTHLGHSGLDPESIRIDLSNFDEVVLLGFGKGSARMAELLSLKLGTHLTRGWVIDVVGGEAEKIAFTIGTHPLPSETNVLFTRSVLQELKTLTEKTLVLVVVCGGGSALFEDPVVPMDTLIAVNQRLQKSGADIFAMNAVRKHISRVKGGGLAKALFPARVVSLLFSDVLGNDMTVIASGPTVLDKSTTEDAWNVVEKYQLGLKREDLVETPKEANCFERVSNTIVLSNMTALVAMQTAAEQLGYATRIVSDQLSGEAREVGEQLIRQAQAPGVFIWGGETTVTVKGKGMGGRNQEVVLGALPSLGDQIVVAINSDGWDNSEHAGAIGDHTTLTKAQEMGLTVDSFLANNNGYEFFQQVGGGIMTGRLPSNVGDLFLVVKP